MRHSLHLRRRNKSFQRQPTLTSCRSLLARLFLMIMGNMSLIWIVVMEKHFKNSSRLKMERELIRKIFSTFSFHKFLGIWSTLGVLKTWPSQHVSTHRMQKTSFTEKFHLKSYFILLITPVWWSKINL